MENQAKKERLKQIGLQALKIGGTIVTAGTLLWTFGKPAVDNYIESQVKQIIEDQQPKKSRWDILGEEMRVPADRLPYDMADWFEQFDSLQADIARFETEYMPFLNFQMSIVPLYRYLDTNGDEWAHRPDGRDYRVNYDNGQPWVMYHGYRVNL